MTLENARRPRHGDDLVIGALCGGRSVELRLRDLALDDDDAAEMYFAVVRTLVDTDVRLGLGPSQDDVATVCNDVFAHLRRYVEGVNPARYTAREGTQHSGLNRTDIEDRQRVLNQQQRLLERATMVSTAEIEPPRGDKLGRRAHQ